MAIRQRRVELGLSQKTLAWAVGITFQQIQKYEKGVNALSVSRLLQIAGLLDSTAEAMLGAAYGEKTQAIGVLSERATLEMMKRAHLLTRQEQKAVACFIQELTEGRPVSKIVRQAPAEGKA